MSDAPPASSLFLVRHGLVDNPNELAYGHLPRFGLSAEGRQQADRAARWLSSHSIRAVFTSPLLRARQTADILRLTLGDVPLHRDRRLRESELARHWQGTVWSEIATLHADLYSMFESSPSEITVGETMTAMAARVAAACLSAQRRYPGAAVALVSHRDPIVALRLTLTSGDLDALNNTACRQGSVVVLRAEGRSLRFVEYVEP